MGQQQSKDELLYQQVNYGNIDGIKSLRSEGVGLEWIDSEGKTPLIVACMNPGLHNVAKTLIELGANVNAYRPGRHAGTPLHHAAKRGLDQTVKLLLSHRANVLVMNDDCQTPLDIARGKGYSNVVRTIEGHVCLFSGWLRELYGPGFLELLAPQLLSRKVWVVVLPCGSRNLRKPLKLELAIYASTQDAQPRLIIPLWKANLEEPNFNLPDPAAIVSDIGSIPIRWSRRRGIKTSQQAKKTRVKLSTANESDKQQLQRFCNACKGIPQVTPPTFPVNTQVPAVQATAPPASEDEEVALAINASLQAAAHERPPSIDSHPVASSSSANVDSSNPGNSYILGASITHKGSDGTLQEAGPSGSQAQHVQTQNIIPSVVQSTLKNPSAVSVPSAPPVADVVTDDCPIHYPSIDSSPVDLSSATVDALPASLDGKIEDNAASSCTICLDAPLEGACIPCGHMAGCMSCLNEIKAKKWGCPVCRANIDQVMRIYAV